MDGARLFAFEEIAGEWPGVAPNPIAKGVRKSLDEIQASGVRFRQLSERANGMMVNTVVMDAPIPLFGGSGVYINGGTVGGLDLMAVFTKEFWNKKGRDNRARTLEVLRTYGDSTTVLINKPIEQIARWRRYNDVLM